MIRTRYLALTLAGIVTFGMIGSSLAQQRPKPPRQPQLPESVRAELNVPYAGAFMNFLSSAWAGSGYGHPPIGSIEDLNAATTADWRSSSAASTSA